MATNFTVRASVLINVENVKNKYLTKCLDSEIVKFKVTILPNPTSRHDLLLNVYGKSIRKGEYFIKMTLSILTKSNKHLLIGNVEVKVATTISWQKIAFFDIQEEFNLKHRYIFGGSNVLTLVFNAGVVDLEMLMEGQHTEHFGTTKILKDIENLWNNQARCDAILIANDLSEFHVHKWFICARSPVFDLMFETDMLEQHTNRVWIEDMTSIALNEMIHFLYTGKVRTVNADVLLELYGAAEKYILCDLKLVAGRLLSVTLSDDVVRDVAATAYLHRDVNLLRNTLRYICQNKETVFRLDEWPRFHQCFLRYSAAIRDSSFGH